MAELAPSPPQQTPGPARRARWPVTVGIIFIIFAAAHLLCFAGLWILALIAVAAGGDTPEPNFRSVAFLALSVGKFLAMFFLLIGGVQLTRRRPAARASCVTYGVLALPCYGGMAAMLLAGASMAEELDAFIVGWLALQGVELLCAVLVVIWFLRPKVQELIDAWRFDGQGVQVAPDPYTNAYSQPYWQPPAEPVPASVGAEDTLQATGETDEAVADSEPPAQPKPADPVLLAKLERQFSSGAKWFYWIAGLSVVNTVIIFNEGDFTFVIGLGITQVIAGVGEVLAEDVGPLARQIALALVVLCTGVFVVFGRYALKRRHWAFITGMVLYALDALIFLGVQDWWSFGFHIFALFCLYGGLRAERQLRDLERGGAEAQAVQAAASKKIPEIFDR